MATQALVFPTRTSSERTALPGRVLELRRERVRLASALIDRVTLDMAVERMRKFLLVGRAHQVVTVNLDFLKIAERNPVFRDTINRADLAVADGMPLVWASRLQQSPLVERVTGVDLVDAGCRLAAAMGKSVFLLGAADGVAAAAGAELQRRIPGLQIAGAYAPPFGSLGRAEDDRIVQTINDARPGFLFVALGAPRQDLWIRSHLNVLDVSVAMGIGCVLDLLAGTAQRAPRVLQQVGLEWAFRLACDPSRLWRRYLVDDLPMFAQLIVSSVQSNGRPSSVLSA